MSDVSYVSTGKINCPVCGQDKDMLTVWHSMDGIAFCACGECIASKLPVFTEREQAAVLKIGFRAGYIMARNEMEGFLNTLIV